MNKTIIVFCKMFDNQSQIVFTEDNEVKRTIFADIDNLNTAIFALLKEQDCHTVNFKGVKAYSKGIAKKLEKYQLENYANFDLKINVI